MKKTLIAFAAIAAVSAAQADVTIYGQLDQGMYNQTDSGNRQSALSSNVNSTSVLGFKGMEDMGGGLSANFDLLSELTLQSGQMGSQTSGDAAVAGGQKPNIFTRKAEISLASKDIGTFQIGRLQDLVWLTQGELNNSGSNSFGFAAYTAQQTNFTSLATLGYGAAAYLTAPTDTTYTGTKTAAGVVGTANQSESGYAPVNFNAGYGYKTPTISGFTGSYQHIGDMYASTAAGYTAASGNAYRLEYTNGPIKAQYATTSRNDATGNTGAQWRTYGATYEIGNYKIIAAQSTLRTQGNFTQIDGNTINGVGVNYKLSAMSDVSFAYTTIQDDNSANNGTKGSVFGLTGRYFFSKRTNVYAGFGQGSNSGGSKITMFYGGPSANTAAAASTTGYLVGVRHTF